MKWSNDAVELGASKVGAVVMGETVFNTCLLYTSDAADE